MTEKTKHTVHKVKFLVSLIVAPVFVGALGFAGAYLLALLSNAWPGLGTPLSPVLILLISAPFAVGYGGVQYLLVGGPILYFYLRRFPPHVGTAAIIGFLVNLILAVAGLTIAALTPAHLSQQYFQLCLMFGSFFAPTWSAISIWLYRKSTSKRASPSSFDAVQR